MTNLHIGDLFDLAALDEAIEGGYVRQQTHPTLPLAVLNYTELAQFERAWTFITTQCRGLIYNTATGEVTARPFPKFFNYGQAEAGDLSLNAPAVVFDKSDGSLAITYPTPDGWAVATRGSFASSQAIHATNILRNRYGQWTPPHGLTVLAEIIYPANRIVIDYHGQDDLVLLGAVDIATGRTFGPDMVPDWPGPVVERFPYRTLAQALSAPVRDNREGFVVWFPVTDTRTKIKYEAYVALHRVMTGITNRKVWEFAAVNACAHLIEKPKHWGSRLALNPARAAEILAAGPRWLDALTADVPDEFHDWLKNIIAGLYADVQALDASTRAEAARLVAKHGLNRAELFLEAHDHEHFGLVIHVIDGHDITTQVWKAVYPDAGGPWLTGEAAA